MSALSGLLRRAPACFAILVAAHAGSAFAQSLKQIACIDLPGPVGKRFDYLTVDYEDHYLLLAHFATGLLNGIDLRTNKLVKAIPGVPGVEGVE